MSRALGTFNLSANFEPKVKGPLDSRMVVETYSDLTNPTTWEDADNLVWLFNGSIVAVAEDPNYLLNGIYLLIDADNYTNPTKWIKSSSYIEVKNVGNGPVSVFKGYDASSNILLRTFKGTAGATVVQTLDEIVIGIDASFSGEINTGANIGNGDVSIFQEKSGDDLKFRTIKGVDPIFITYGDLDTIQIDLSMGQSVHTSNVVYDNSLDPSLAMPNTVGGIPAGTTAGDLEGETVKAILNDLLFPTVNPTFINPSNTFVDDVAGLYEVNTPLTIEYTASFNRGQILVSSNFQNYRSGLPHSYYYTDPSGNTLLTDISSNILSNTQTITGYVVKQGIQTWRSNVGYLTGPQPLDNKGNPYGSPLPDGSTGFKSISIQGAYPLFGTTSVISTLTKQSLVSMITANNIVMNLVPETGGDKQKIDIPDKWLSQPRPLVGIQQYNTVSASWEYPGGNAASSLLLWNISTNTHTIAGISENYTQYTYNGTDRSSTQIRLIF